MANYWDVLIVCAILLRSFVAPGPVPEKESKSSPAEDFVVNGQNASVGQWPWAAAIHKIYVPGAWCGGSLIGERTVLTAAHCFTQTKDPKKYSVIVGREYLKNVPKANIYKVEAIIVHEHYFPDMKANSPNDIAIVRLARPLNTSDWAHPIALPTRGQDEVPQGIDCDAAGWGESGHNRHVFKMKHVRLQVRNMYVCQFYFPYTYFYYPERQLCAGGLKINNVCDGDSGGPLACKRDGKYVLEGVVSFGFQYCGYYRSLRFPTVFTRVSVFVDWMKPAIDRALGNLDSTL